MLVEVETGVVAKIRQSALASRLRQVDSLPDLEGDTLVDRFFSDAPAVYVAMGSFLVKNRQARLKYGIACVARNSRSHHAARHGDGVVIGLYDMLDAVMVLSDGITVGFDGGAVGFEVIACDLVTSEALFKKGVYVGVVQIQSTTEVTLPDSIEMLADFNTFATAWDIDPHQPASEHQKWAAEPPDHSSSAPELSDTLSLNQE